MQGGRAGVCFAEKAGVGGGAGGGKPGEHRERVLSKAAIDWTAGSLFTKNRGFNYSLCCVLAHSSKAWISVQGFLQDTNPSDSFSIP